MDESQEQEAEFKELETAMEEERPGIIIRFKKSYETLGPNQFRQNEEGAICKSGFAH